MAENETNSTSSVKPKVSSNSSIPSAITGFSSIIGIATNAIQRGQEKERQERIDAYNKELNDRNFYAVQLQNSPSYQMQRLKDAGYNPLAQGIAPTSESAEAGSTLSPQPMETSSTGNSIISAGQGVANAMLAEDTRAIQRGQLEVQQKQVDVEQAKVDLEAKKVDIQQGFTIMDTVLDLYRKGQISLKDCNAVCGRYGFEVIGQGLDAQLKRAEIERVQEDTNKIRAETGKVKADTAKVKEETTLVRRQGELISVEREIKEFEKEYKVIELQQLCQRRGLEIDKLSTEVGSISINNERAELARQVEEIRAQIIKVYGSVEDVPLLERMRLIENVKEVWTKTGYFHDKFMFLPSEDYKQFCEWMLQNERDLAQQEYWSGWFNMVSNAVQAGATVYGATKLGQGLIRQPVPRIYTPENYAPSPVTIPYR